MPLSQMSVERAQIFGPEHEDRFTRMSGPPSGNTGQNIDKGHAPNSRIEIKISDPAGNRSRAAGLESRDSNDHSTADSITA